MEGFAERIRYQAHDGADDYCGFAGPDSFIAGYWRFIGRSVYDGWRAHADEPVGYIQFLKSRGYAGARDYVERVTRLLPQAEALLGRGTGESGGTGQDSGPGTDAIEPDRPNREDLGETLDDLLGSDDVPEFVSMPQVTHRWRGRRPNGLEGAIVHYDAGRSRPTRGADNTEWGAKNTLAGGETNGYAYATISRSGKIYLPQNMDWLSWGYHAGTSKCPRTSRTGVSQFYVGFEVNCPGFVYPTDDTDVFVPWFDAVRDGNGRVILDNRGRARVANENGELYKKSQLRHVASQTGNIRPGAYVPYTDEQFRALVAVLLWLKRRHTSTFRLDYVFGHDEVSPGRKIDPGGSVGVHRGSSPGAAMKMSDLRSELLRRWADQQGLG